MPDTSDGLRWWSKVGHFADDYDAVVDEHGGPDRGRAARVSSLTDAPRGHGGLMQRILAVDYVGRRVRWSGLVKTADLRGWCGLWLRVDGARGNLLDFDNMQSRPLKGSTDWTRCEVVLDVSDDATALAFGVVVEGAGQVWVTELALAVVGADVPVTASTPRAPRNLSFSG